MFTTFSNLGRAAVLALVMGGTTLAAAPAFAQESGPSLSFNLQVPGAPQRGFDNGRRHEGDRDYRPERRCLTNREVRDGLARNGYRRIDITRELSRSRVDVEAQYGSYLYSMRIDKCTGDASRVRRLERVGRPGDNRPGNGPGRGDNRGGYDNGDGYDNRGSNDNDGRDRGGRGSDGRGPDQQNNGSSFGFTFRS